MRACAKHLALVLAAAVLPAVPLPAVAGWLPDGAPIAVAPGNQSAPGMAPDGAGGAYLAWADARILPVQAFVQRITATGDPAPGWPANGRLVAGSTLAQTGVVVAPDGAGGALVSWSVRHADGSVFQMLERIRGDGSLAPGWPASGVTCDSIANGGTASCQFSGAPQGIVPDGVGGAFVLYYFGTYSCLGYSCSGGGTNYALHVNAGGVPDWAAPGVPVGGTPLFYPNTVGILGATGIPDGSGGLVAFGYGYEGGNTLKHVNAAGAVLWTASFGSVIGSLGQLAPDGSGGVYAVWDNLTAPVVTDGDSVVAQHWTASGAIAPGWPAQGAALGLAASNGSVLGCAPDGAGGVLAEWSQELGGSNHPTLLASRVLQDGAPAPDWPAGGEPVTTMPGAGPPAAMVADGAGGAFFAWTNPAPDVFGVRLDGAGSVAAGWSVGGTPVCTASGSQTLTAAISPEPGEAFFAWQDGRNGVDADVFAQKLPFDQAVPVEVSVAQATAGPDGARLEWLVVGQVTGPIQVERSRDGVSWVTLGTAPRDGSGMVTWVDRAAEPGARLAYRLSLDLSGRATEAGEAWVTMPGARLAIVRSTPNPSRGWPTVTVTLPAGERATLELLDAAGRRVAAEDVGAPGAGTHAVRLAGARLPPAGIYLLRLTQGARAVTARVQILP